MSLVRSQSISFSLNPHETLLDGLERTGHEVEYQCRGGYCGMCRVRMLSGEVHYLEQPLAFVASDEILPCCCVPRGEISIDSQLRAELIVWQEQGDLFPVQQDLFSAELDHAEQHRPAKKTSRKPRVKAPAQPPTLPLF